MDMFIVKMKKKKSLYFVFFVVDFFYLIDIIYLDNVDIIDYYKLFYNWCK